MNMLGICAVFCLMIIHAVDVCDAGCDEYVVVFEEITCPSHVRLTPLKRRDINCDKMQGYPCNSTDKNPGKKKCLVEFDCLGTQGSCQNHIKKVNHQTHSFIDNLTAKPTTSTTEAIDVPKSNITVENKPHHTVDEDFNTSTYDINLIYVNDNVIQNSSLKTTKNLYCDYAETVCVDEWRPENYSLSDVKNVHTLEISINRDETSTVQPLFTGYFPESSNDSSTNHENNFNFLKTGTLSCSTLKYNNCKQNIENKSSKQINVYIKTNFIENNTITKYPDCTKDSITSENVLSLKCEDILFAKHNPQIVQPPPPKEELSGWHCQIPELNTLSSKEKSSENNKIHFINCSSETYFISNNKNKYEDINATSITDGKTTVYNILTRGGIKINKTGISTRKEEINIDPSSQTNPENIITILITEKVNNCSDNPYLNINEGKIIDLGINNNKEKILQNNNVELILSNCIYVNSSIINETHPHPKVELNIILKNESLNASNLKHFNGTPKDESLKRRILLRCDYPNLDFSSNTTSNKTVLQCESIDLVFYNITGIESTPISQNKTKQEVSNWNCKIFEFNDTLSPKEQHREKSKLYFKNCTNDVNIINNKNKSVDNNVTPISDSKDKTIDSTKDDIKRNTTEMLSGKLELNKHNLSHTNAANEIKISVTEKANNCSNNSSLNIDEGKIIDLRANNNKKKFLQNNIIELKLSTCIDVNSKINNDIEPDSKVELTIILKSESLNDSNLKQFNGTAKLESVKQRILLRCDHPNLDSSNNTTSNTVLQCDFIDLDLYNITGIEISTNVCPTSNVNNTTKKKKENLKKLDENHNKTKVNEEVNKNNNLSTNKTVENNETTVNNKSNENNIKVVENSDVQKNIPEGNENNTNVVRNKELQKKISEKKEKSKTLNFNRKKDIPNGAGQNSLALGSTDTEKILFIALLTISSVAILILIALRICPKKREYNPAPTREPPDEEETAF